MVIPNLRYRFKSDVFLFLCENLSKTKNTLFNSNLSIVTNIVFSAGKRLALVLTSKKFLRNMYLAAFSQFKRDLCSLNSVDRPTVEMLAGSFRHLKHTHL